MLEKNIKKIDKLIEESLRFKQKGDLINAELLLEKAIKIDPNNFVVLNNFGNIHSARNKPAIAKKYFTKAIDINPKYSKALFNLALVNEEMGNIKNAIKLYKDAIKSDPKNIGFHYNLSRIDKAYFNEDNIKKITKTLKKKNLSEFDKSSCFFILAHDQKRKKNFEREFQYLSEAHKSFHSSSEKINNQVAFYWIRLIPKIIENFNFSPKKSLLENVKPIFIMGLPRSGSTLIESIISSGKKTIPNGGETSTINRVLLDDNKSFFEGKEFLDNNKKLKINKSSFAKKTISQYKLLNLIDESREGIFTDKSLENFFFIELIINIFPKAKIINCERNILDIIISIYENFLPNIKWGHSIGNILEYVDNYLRVITKFKNKHANKIHTVKLEEFTKNSKNLSKDIFSFCDLEWDIKCLEFYKRDDLVSKTASNHQIRNKIHINNEKKNNVYAKLLRPYSSKYKWLKEFL